MLARARAKSAEFASATWSLLVSRPPTHLAKAAAFAAAFGSTLCATPSQPLGRSVGRSTMAFSCGRNAGDGAATGLLVALTVAGAVVAADELPHPARTTTNPAAQARTRYLLHLSLSFGRCRADILIWSIPGSPVAR